MEGIVAKKIDSKYEVSMRTNNWLKIKNIKSDIFLIGGYIDKEKNHVISLLLGKYQEKEFIYVGKVMLAKKDKMYSIIKKKRKQKDSPFKKYQDCDAVYIKPELLIEVSYLNYSSNKHLRHPFIP